MWGILGLDSAPGSAGQLEMSHWSFLSLSCPLRVTTVTVFILSPLLAGRDSGRHCVNRGLGLCVLEVRELACGPGMLKSGHVTGWDICTTLQATPTGHETILGLASCQELAGGPCGARREVGGPWNRCQVLVWCPGWLESAQVLGAGPLALVLAV